MDEASAKRLARMKLMGMAERARQAGRSAPEWEELVEDTPEGKRLGKNEVRAIGFIIFVGWKLG